jgi:predicted PurR-regulated permease PerM
MTPTRQALIWIGGLVVLGLALHVLAPILLPFVVGFAVAYFLDPAVQWLDRHGVGRTLATVLVLVVFSATVIMVLALVLPLVQGQIISFAQKAPELFRVLQERVMDAIARVSAELSAADVERLKSAAGGVAGDVLKFAGALVARAWSGGLAFLNLLSLIFISPVVAFYILRDWDKIVAKVRGWLPRDHQKTIERLVGEADAMIAGFVRGMALVCLILGAFYGTALTLIGLEFGLVVGLVAGLISFIPFVGAAVGFVVSVGLAVVQFADWVPIALTAGVFIAGQAIEGNFLTPKLVGERIQLHAVWVIFALLAGGLLFGFVGVLLAVPLAAVIGVLVRFFIGRYLDSSLYRGDGGRAS